MMRRNPILFLSVLVLVIPGLVRAEKVDLKAEVRSAVQTFGNAFVLADVPRLASLLTDDYVHINGQSGSVLNKTDWLKWVESRREELNRGDLIIVNYEIEDLDIVL